MRITSRVLLTPLIALGLLAGIGLSAGPAAAHGTSRHVLTIGGTLRITDDENWPSSDEHCTRTLSGFDSAQLPTDNTAFFADTDNGCGGEIRIEVWTNAVLDSNGTFCINGHVDLYEGTSERTTDLDGSAPFSTCVAQGGNVRIAGRVWNTAEGGDFVDVDFTYTNQH